MEAGPVARESAPTSPAAQAVDWAVAHLSEREAVFSRNDLFAAALAHSPGAAAMENVEREVAAREKAGTLHAARMPGAEGLLTTDRAVADERETIALMRAGADGRSVAWEPNRIAARTGGVEVYRPDEIELRAGDRIRWTRNAAGLGLVNSGTAEVAAVKDVRVTFRLEDGRTIDLSPGDPQLRHLDRAWASTVHAFQGRTVDTVIAAMEANHPHLTTQKSFYVEISRARDRAELVTDDRAALKEQLEAATGERIAALEAVEPERARGREVESDAVGKRDRSSDRAAQRERTAGPGVEKTRAPKSVDRGLGL